MRWHTLQQSSRIRVLRPFKNHIRCTNFRDFPRVQNEDPIRQAWQQSWIVSDQNHRQVEFLPECSKERKNLLLRRWIQRGRRLIRDDQRWSASDRLGNQHPLLLTPTQLMWV